MYRLKVDAIHSAAPNPIIQTISIASARSFRMFTKRVRHLALSVVVSGLVALPAMAQTFSFDAVTCLNHSTGQAVVGSLQSGGIDCSGLQTQPGDPVGVVLNGVADGSGGGGGPVSCDQSQPISEQEPNDWPEVNEVGDLSGGGCVTISGNIHTGYDNPQQPNPQRDADNFVVFVAPQGSYGMTLSGGAIAGVFDGRSGEFLTECQGSCTLQAPSDVLVVEVLAQQPTAYTLQIASDSGSQPIAPRADSLSRQAPSAYGFGGEMRQY
jgi:hypothetical protein